MTDNITIPRATVQQAISLLGTTEESIKVLKAALEQQQAEPPQRPWVGLEIEEVQDSYNSNYQAQTRAVEAKLKEKNT